MKQMLTTRLFTLFAALSLIAIGAAGSHSMAPDRDSAARTVTMLVFGGTLDDLCLDGADGHAHDCPLCHKVPDSVQAMAPDGHGPLAVSRVYRSLPAQVATPSRQSSIALARAPPALA